MKIHSLKITAHPQSSYQYRGICSALFIICNVFMEMPFGIILHMCSLNTCISKSNHSDNLSVIPIVKPTISLAHKIILIGNNIIGEEIVKVVFPT